MKPILHTLRGLWSQFLQLPLLTKIASGIFLLLVVTLGVLNLPSQNNKENTTETEITVARIATQTVGAETEAFATFASWPGEIISPNDADVQPPRSGTIISWDVSIGDYVKAGQVLGWLSAAPLTPDLALTLAERSAASLQAKAKAAAFTTSDTALRAIEDAKQLMFSSGETVKSTLRQSLVKEFAVFSGSGRDVLSSDDALYTTSIPRYFGATNSSLRDKYITSTGRVLAVLEKNTIPQSEGVEYFLASTRLASASVAAGENFTQVQLDAFRKEIAEDQTAFNDAIEKYRSAILGVSEKEKEYLGLNREQAVAQAEADGAEAAFRAVSRAITGGTAVVAPRGGYVSSIMSQIGEFVEPGKAVASISSGVQTNKIVRFRIPSNVEIPKKGDKVKIIRPGFSKDVRNATISGVGTGLDGNGSFMADARIEGPLEWPAHLSVRVVPEKRTSQTIAVPFEAVFWDEANSPHVWVVGSGGVITSRVVKTGRTFGDAVEVLEGLTLGDTYILQTSENIKEGMRIEETVTSATSTPEGDGHGHAHEE